jgi:hypothetical protein
MPLKLGGTTLSKVTYNGVELTKVIYNGTTVYEVVTDPEPNYVYYSFSNSSNIAYRYNGNLTTLLRTETNTNYDGITSMEVGTTAQGFFYYSAPDRRVYRAARTLGAPAFSSAQYTSTNNRFNLTKDNSFIYATAGGANVVRLLMGNFFNTTTVAFGGIVNQILVDDNYVYAVVGTSIIRRTKPLSSSSASLSVGFTGTANAMAQDAEFLYVITNSNPRWFVKIRKSDMVKVVEMNNTALIPTRHNQIQVDKNHVYSIADNLEAITRCNLDGTNMVLVALSSQPASIRLSGSNIYIGTSNGQFIIISKTNFNTGTTIDVAGSGFIQGFVLDYGE